MKRFSLSKIQSLVFILLFTLISFNVKADGGASIDLSKLGWNPQQACNDRATQIATEYATAQVNCGSDSNNVDSCLKVIKDCLSSSSDEDSDLDGTCYTLGRQNYKSDLKDLKQDDKDARKSLQDLMKDKTDATKSYNEDKAKLSKDAQDENDNYNEQQMKDKEDQRKQAQDQKSSQDDLNKQIRDLQMQILQKQNQQSLLTSQRATQLDDYKMNLLQCKADTAKYKDQVKNNTMGGLAALSVKGGGAANDVQMYWETCVNEKVLKARDNDANKYSVAMSQLNAEITAATQQLNDAQQSLQLMQSQSQQQSTDNQTKTQQALMSHAQKLQNISTQMTDLSNNYNQQISQYQQQILQAQQDNNMSSSELKKFQGQEMPKTNTAMDTSYSALNKVKALCQVNASDTNCGPVQICGDFSSSGKTKHITTPSRPQGTVDGT